ncbi:MAG: hypothetical protein GY951_10200 [Psychromonas sp.]|nr:hypothetical protein [Psychromonas sp.]
MKGIKLITFWGILFCSSVFSQVSIQPVENNVYAMEPILINLVIENTENHEKYYLLPQINTFGISGIHFYVSPPQRDAFTKIDLPNIHIGASKSQPPPRYYMAIKLLPGQRYENNYVLAFDFMSKHVFEWVFSEAGSYTIKATVYEVIAPGKVKNPYVPPDAIIVPTDSVIEDIYSNEIVVDVVEFDSVQLSAYTAIPDYYLLYDIDSYEDYVNTYGGDFRKVFADLNTFKQHYPNSYLTSYINLFLANDAMFKGDSELAKQLFSEAFENSSQTAQHLIKKRMQTVNFDSSDIALAESNAQKSINKKVVRLKNASTKEASHSEVLQTVEASPQEKVNKGSVLWYWLAAIITVFIGFALWFKRKI